MSFKGGQGQLDKLSGNLRRDLSAIFTFAAVSCNREIYHSSIMRVYLDRAAVLIARHNPGAGSTPVVLVSCTDVLDTGYLQLALRSLSRESREEEKIYVCMEYIEGQ